MKTDIEIGEYVRTKDGKIGIFDRYSSRKGTSVYKSIFNCFIKIKNRKTPLQCCEDFIVNHSKQLIELIAVGDFANGYRILAIEDSIYKNSKRILIYKNEREKYERWIYIQDYNGRIHTQDDLVEILTKEQYNNNCYKVGE